MGEIGWGESHAKRFNPVVFTLLSPVGRSHALRSFNWVRPPRHCQAPRTSGWVGPHRAGPGQNLGPWHHAWRVLGIKMDEVSQLWWTIMMNDHKYNHIHIHICISQLILRRIKSPMSELIQHYWQLSTIVLNSHHQSRSLLFAKITKC